MTTKVAKAARHKSYCPSNGTEGDAFMSKWCGECKHLGDVGWEDAVELLCQDKEPCPILGASFNHRPGQKGYPREWCYNDAGVPICTAFEYKYSPDRPYRCTETVDLFSPQPKE